MRYKGHNFNSIAPTPSGQGAGLYGACVNSDGDGTMFASGKAMGMIKVANIFLEGLGNSMVFKGTPKREGSTRACGHLECEIENATLKYLG